MPAERVEGVPRHIALIPDGNRRWATKRGLPTYEGHKKGFENFFALLKKARKMGVQTFTVWALSMDNVNKRDQNELEYLYRLYDEMVDRHLEEAKRHETRIIHAGRKDVIPPFLAEKIAHAEEETADFSANYFVVALAYGGEDELERAVNAWRLANTDEPFTIKALGHFLDTRDLPQQEIDLIIRTGGDQRISDFFRLQTKHSELRVVGVYMPDFTVDHLEDAIRDFASTERRFGGDPVKDFRE